MQISLPKEIEHYEPELRFFFDLMVRKLHICRDKGFGEGKTTTQMFSQLEDETEELKRAMQNESQFQTALECVDVANQAWLLALVVLRLTRPDFNSQRNAPNSKFTFNPDTGDPVRVPPITPPIGYGNKGAAFDPYNDEWVPPYTEEKLK